MDITVKMARFQIKQSVLIGNTTLALSTETNFNDYESRDAMNSRTI